MRLVEFETWYVGVQIIFAPSVRITACRTLTICAIFAMTTRSQWLLKISSVSAATIASRMVFC